jgi:sugar phosphate isomerase/epimerase
MEYGIQMYSLRDITGKDLDGALAAVSKIGYKFVEFAGFFGHSAEDVRAMLDKYGLEVSGTHTGWQEVAYHYEDTVRYHKTIGNKNIIVPGADLGTKAKLDDFIAMYNEFAPKLKAEGITFQYHNHSHEFFMTPEGYEIHKELETRTDIIFEIDTFWAFNAGRDPVELITRLKDRIMFVHLKDGFKDGRGVSLGSGEAPVPAIRDTASKLGFKMVVESEGCDPTGIEEVTRCYGYLRTLD